MQIVTLEIGEVIGVLFVVIAVIAAIVRSVQEQKERAERTRRRATRGGSDASSAGRGEYQAPADEVRKFLEEVRRRQGGQAASRPLPGSVPERPQAPPSTSSNRQWERQQALEATKAEAATERQRAERQRAETAQAQEAVREEERRARKAAERAQAEAKRRRVVVEEIEEIEEEDLIVEVEETTEPVRGRPRPRRRRKNAGPAILALLRDRSDLQRAIVLSEILGPPKALR